MTAVSPIFLPRQHPKSEFHLYYLLYTSEGLANLSETLTHIFIKIQGLAQPVGSYQF